MVTLGHIEMRQNFNSLTMKCMMLFIIKKEISQNLDNGKTGKTQKKDEVGPKIYVIFLGGFPSWLVSPPSHTAHVWLEL